MTARRIAARRRPLPPSPSVCLTSIRRRTRRNPRPCVWTADSGLTSEYLTLCGKFTWETILPIPDGTCSKWLYCRLGGDPSLPRSSDCIASYIPTGLLQHWYQLQVRAHASAALNWSSGTRIAVWQLPFDTCADARLWGPDSSKLGNPSARVVASALIICYVIKYISEGVWLCVFVDLFSLFVSAVANCQTFQDGAHCLLGRGKFDWGVNGLQFQNGNRFGTQRRQWY